MSSFRCLISAGQSDNHLQGFFSLLNHTCMGARKVVLVFTAEMVTTVNPLFSPPGGLFFSSTLEGGLFNLAKPGAFLAKRINWSEKGFSRTDLWFPGVINTGGEDGGEGEGGGENLIERGGLLTFLL